jgi:hypothetical protein
MFQVSDELSARFTACEADDSIRAMKVVIEDGELDVQYNRSSLI